jgi:uncharacterized protein (TIGR03067 family)
MSRRGAWAVAALFGLAVAAAGNADEPKEDAVKKELKALDGTWEITSVLKDGKEMPIPPGAAQVVISGGKYREIVDGKEMESGTFTVDPGKTPKAMDISILEGNDKGKKQLAIYELKGDELKMSVAPPDGKDRPTDLTGKATGVVTYKRKK